MGKEIENWAGSIIVQALVEIQSLDDIERVDDKVRSTAISAVPEYLSKWEKVLEAKRKLLESKAGRDKE